MIARSRRACQTYQASPPSTIPISNALTDGFITTASSFLSRQHRDAVNPQFPHDRQQAPDFLEPVEGRDHRGRLEILDDFEAFLFECFANGFLGAQAGVGRILLEVTPGLDSLDPVFWVGGVDVV